MADVQQQIPIAPPSTTNTNIAALKNLYNDPATRAKIVEQYLTNIGLQKFGIDVNLLAKCTTLNGLKDTAPDYCPSLYEKTTNLYASTAPVVAAAANRLPKVKNAEGRAELWSETKDLAAPYITNTKELADTKLFAPTKELAAPYISQLNAKRAAFHERKEALLADKRLCKALESLKAAKEHPIETAQELKSLAVDLIKYDKIAAYREYVLSEAFAADTKRLLQEELPALAAAGYSSVQARAASLAAEVDKSANAIRSALINPEATQEAEAPPYLEGVLSLAHKARSFVLDVASHTEGVLEKSPRAKAAAATLARLAGVEWILESETNKEANMEDDDTALRTFPDLSEDEELPPPPADGEPLPPPRHPTSPPLTA